MENNIADISTRSGVDLDVTLRTMLENYAIRTQQPGTANIPLNFVGHRVNEAKLSGESISASVAGSVEILTVTQNTIRNDLSHEISLPVPGFSYVETSETSTTNSSGWVFTYGLETTASVDVLFASGGITHNFSVEYNMSTQNTVTRTTQRSWTVEPFSISVPANRRYRVDYVMERVIASGRSTVRAELYGIANYVARTNGVRHDSPLGSIARVMSSWGESPSQSGGFLDGGWPSHPAINSAETSFRTNYGLRFDVRIFDITNIRNSEEQGIFIGESNFPARFEIFRDDVIVSQEV
ncbi:ETX/MTX2 family pore-forming toxin [Pseudomonas sp. N3-W]|uniref:ETX/MTX2 family pore-forming toxin n=1 Tax=Pseudomonas sp. N3-W TaxID=2975049 RepID=UPI00217E2EBB|nr:ETX/MTX2 family pore-forming toxin [Pseudomonas sp. N3-W]UWF46858.1 ETX/MTX2 family pore-forming toxin [Pseudomonas sp. N3-W]